MKMAVFWDDILYNLVDTDWHFRGAYVGQYLLDYVANVPEDSHLYIYDCENLKFHTENHDHVELL